MSSVSIPNRARKMCSKNSNKPELFKKDVRKSHSHRGIDAFDHEKIQKNSIMSKKDGDIHHPQSARFQSGNRVYKVVMLGQGGVGKSG